MGVRNTRAAGLHWVFPLSVSVLALFLSLVVLLSGLAGSSPAAFITVDVTNLAIPAKLSSSKFLQDLSLVTGNNLVGNARTRASLGLASSYSVSLLTACGQDQGSTTCSLPRVGFTFDPFSDLKIGSGSISTNTPILLSSQFFNELKTYAAVSTFAGVAYIFSSLFFFVSCVSLVLSRRLRIAGLVGRGTSFLASVLLTSSTIATIAIFSNVRREFDAAFNGIGVSTTMNPGAIGLSVVVAVLAIAGFVLMLFVRPYTMNTTDYNDYNINKTVEGIEEEEEDIGASATLKSRRSRSAAAAAAAPGISIGLLDRVPKWKQGRYAQIRNSSGHVRDISPESDREVLVDPNRERMAHGTVTGASGHPYGA